METEIEVKACNETHCDLVVVVDVKKATSFDETHDARKATSFDETYDVKKATTSWGNIRCEKKQPV